MTETTTETVSAWVLRQIEADEAVAQQAAEAYDSDVWHEGWWENIPERDVNHTSGYTVNDANGVLIADLIEEHRAHIARQDPAHTRALCAALRAIVEMHARFADTYPDMVGEREYANDCVTCDGAERQWPCPTIRALALAYADRPGFQDSWR